MCLKYIIMRAKSAIVHDGTGLLERTKEQCYALMKLNSNNKSTESEKCDGINFRPSDTDSGRFLQTSITGNLKPEDLRK